MILTFRLHNAIIVLECIMQSKEEEQYAAAGI